MHESPPSDAPDPGDALPFGHLPDLDGEESRQPARKKPRRQKEAPPAAAEDTSDDGGPEPALEEADRGPDPPAAPGGGFGAGVLAQPLPVPEPPKTTSSGSGPSIAERARVADALAREERRSRKPAAAPTEYAPDGRVSKWKGFTLSRFQLQAVDAIRQGKNVLVSAPTGAGKTLVAEYAIEDAVQRGQRCIYTAPIKALSNQKYRDFRDDPDIDVGLMTGDVTIHPKARVLIMTTEILRNAIFENPRLLSDVAFVIFDEVHYLDDKERGMVWEESFIFLPPSVRVVALSATIQNVDELGNWIHEVRPQDMEVIKESKRPVPLSHWVHSTLSGTFPANRVDQAQKREARAAEGLKKRGGARRSRRGGRGRGRSRPPRREDEGFDPVPLFDQLVEDRMLPCLVFSFSRKDCERLARKATKRGLLDDEEAERMEALQEQLLELFQLGRGHLRGEVFKLARSGVAYHHAGMLPVYKEVVERMFTEGLLKLLFTTETFALGINMPAKAVVFHGLKKFDGISFDWLRNRDYMQMAGRAGRQGIDDKGFVYQLLSTSELQEAPVKSWVAGSPEPVMSRFRMNYSTLLHLVTKLGREEVFDAWEKSFAAWQSREKNEKAREKQKRIQRRMIERHLELLDELGYLDGDEVTPRGKLARMIPGYELQLAELLFRGSLEGVPPRALAMIAVAMIYEERRAAQRTYVPSKMYGNVRSHVDGVIGELCSVEARYGISPGMKRPDWGLTPAVLAWYGGLSMEELEEELGVNVGDVCRVIRMAVQLLRNLRRSIDRKWDLADRLEEAAMALNRDEIDARRQLELG